MERTNTRASKGRYYARYIAHYTKHNVALIMLGLLFVFGLCLGTLLVQTTRSDLMDTFSQLLNSHILKRQAGSFNQNLFSGAAASMPLLLTVLLAGFWALAKPVIWAIPFLKGMGTGFLLGSLYSWHGIRATSFIAAFILPNLAISSIVIILACREALKMSGIFFSVLRPNTDPQQYSIRLYLFKFLILALLCVFSALLEAMAYLFLSGRIAL